MMRRAGGALCAALLLGCGSDEWDVDTPERHSYDDSRPPFAELEGDPEALAVPFTQVGEDDEGPGIVYTAALAGYYLMRIQDSSIGYHYEYDPEAGEFSEDDNLHRKAGATFTQIWLYRFTRREEFRLSTRHAIEYLLSRAAWQDDGSLRLRDLGATALISLSLTEYGRLAETDQWDAEIAGLGQHLLMRVQEDGSFSEGTPLQWAQSHQALWRHYKYSGDEAYLDALRSVARYFYDHKDDDDIIGPYYLYGLWANEPLTEMYLESPEDWMSELVLRVGDRVVSAQYTPTDDVDSDWVGGFLPNDGEGEPNWNSTLKLEAVIDAYRMAVTVGDDTRTDRYRKSALIGTAFLQRLQHRQEDTGDFSDGSFAVGGTPYSLTDPKVRLDVPHHMANAILKVVEYMDLEDYPGREE